MGKYYSCYHQVDEVLYVLQFNISREVCWLNSLKHSQYITVCRSKCKEEKGTFFKIIIVLYKIKAIIFLLYIPSWFTISELSGCGLFAILRGLLSPSLRFCKVFIFYFDLIDKVD